ncbi:MAG TPA: acyl-ACP--UDP-N-acetylglucosamine O-acyltransferase [Verrucomicrobiota bacterium]|nr:acyl-ACP--UDP-N-acetylglucosamine O-acyltransferase [Verrucomicrobiota bacterium]
MIHPTAIVHPRAKLHSTVCVGPYAVIDEGVVMGAGCVVGPYVYLTGQSTIGERNRFHAGCVIGDAPQDLKYKDEPTRLRIGDDNVFREHVTIHRSTTAEGETEIGSNNYLMANCHVAHNCRLGNHVIIANGAMLGGHVVVEDKVFISGSCMLHQFARVGTLALMQGGSGISKDLPPFTIASGNNRICGLNIIGLRRAGLDTCQRLELKSAYKLLFRSGLKMADAVAAARERFGGGAVKTLVDFVQSTRRGVCRHAGRSNSGTETED